MPSMPLRVSVLLVSLLVPGVPVSAQDRGVAGPRRDEPTKVRNYRETAISPDGKWVAWVEELDDGESSGHSAIFVTELAVTEAATRRITAGDGKAGCTEHSVAWSPDGGRLAFLSDHDKEGQFQLYVAPATGGEVKRLTRVTGFLTDPRWSPDGTRLGVLYMKDAKATGPLQPGEIKTGVIDEKVIEQRLCTINVSSGEFRELSPPELHVYEYDWSPDGTRCVAIAAHGSGDNNWYIAQLYVMDMATGATKLILDPKMQVAVATMVARWAEHCVHRRADERRRGDGRRPLRRARERRNSEQPHDEPPGIGKLVRLVPLLQVHPLRRAQRRRQRPHSS